jgi:hypothetical protein
MRHVAGKVLTASRELWDGSQHWQGSVAALDATRPTASAQCAVRRPRVQTSVAMPRRLANGMTAMKLRTNTAVWPHCRREIYEMPSPLRHRLAVSKIDPRSNDLETAPLWSIAVAPASKKSEPSEGRNVAAYCDLRVFNTHSMRLLPGKNILRHARRRSRRG